MSDGLAVVEFADAGKASEALPLAPSRRQTSRRITRRSTLSSRPNSPARCPASPFRKSSRGSFPSTILSAPVPLAAASATSRRSTPISSCPNPKLTLRKGAIAPWAKSTSPYYQQTLEALGKHYKFRLDTPFEELSEEGADVILYGSGDEEIRFSYDDGLRAYDVKKPFEGVVTNLERRYLETDSEWAREEIGRYMSATPCVACEGYRLQARGAGGEDRRQAYRRSVGAFGARRARLVRALPGKLDKKRNEIANRILKEIRDRLTFLVDVGLDYLTLSRTSGTLSGGESQRIRLASQIGSGLTGVLYVLDEPSIGLHQRDNDRLLDTLRRLRDLGNSVIVVEHDEDAILAADYVVDVGPGAGIHGGEIVAQGHAAEIMANPNSLTGQYLTGAKQVILRHRLRKPTPGRRLEALRRARQQSQKCHGARFRSGFSPASPASPAAANRR